MANGWGGLVVLLPKAEKLVGREAQTGLAGAQEGLGPYAEEPADVSVTLFSALSRAGVDDVAQTLHAWVAAHGSAWAPPAAGVPPVASEPAGAHGPQGRQ